MRRRSTCALMLAVLVSGCAAQHEETSRKESAPASERDHDASNEEQFAPEPAALADAVDDEQPDGLEQIQRELAANNTRLRELGVDLPGDHPTGGSTATKKATGEGGRSAVAPTPADEPAPKTAKPSERKPSKREGKGKDDAKGGAGAGTGADAIGPRADLDARSGRDAAKSSPSSPTLDAAARCQQVCDLAAIGCGLGDQICELADRHPDEPEYAAACERANADCEAAKEACHACAK